MSECFGHFLFSDQIARLYKVLELFHRQQRLLVNVLIKYTCFALAVSEDHEADAMLQTIIPISSVDGSVVPVHLTITALYIVDVMTFVLTASAPAELTISVFLVILVAALILITVFVSTLLPLTLSILLAIVELAHVRVAVGPRVLTVAFGFSVEVLTDV